MVAFLPLLALYGYPLVFANAASFSGPSTKPWFGDLLKPRLTPKAYQKAITIQGLLAHSKALQSIADANAHTRVFGSKGYNQSADYVESLARKHDYHVYRQPTTYPASQIISNSLVVNGQNITNITTFAYSGATKGLTAPLSLVRDLGCVSEDFPAAVSGNIALIIRGNCTFALKASLAQQAGAKGVIIYNNIAGGAAVASSIDVTYETNIPALSLAQAAAVPIVELLSTSTSPINATIQIDIINELRIADNVIAQTKYGNQNKVVFVGSHLDSVQAGPGINDDGSGTGSVAELLKQLSTFKQTKNAVRFAWWATEEAGLVGSHYYVDHLSQIEKDKILVYLNMDMIASRNYILGVYDGDNSAGNNTGGPTPPGTAALESLLINHFAEANLNSTPYAFTGGSDYRGFLDAGIVAGGVSSGAGGLKSEREAALFGGQIGVPYDVCYHQACDTLENLANDPYLWISQSIADVVAQLAVDASPIEQEQGLEAGVIEGRHKGVRERAFHVGHEREPDR